MCSEKLFKRESIYNNHMSNNIIDQPIPEIKVPILKPIKVKNTVDLSTIKTIVDNTQKQLNKFADWIMSYFPKEVKKLFNKHVGDLKNKVTNIYNSLRNHEVNQ